MRWVALVLGLGWTASAQASPAARAARLVDASVAAYQAGDLGRALKKLDRAIALDPQSQALHWMRVQLLDAIRPMVEGPTAEAFTTALLTELALTAALDPDTEVGRFAAGLHRKLTTGDSFPEPTAACPDEAVSRYDAAEALFGKGDMAGARRGYDDALALCPDHPVWWTYAGDAALAVGAVEDAAADYGKALELAPCYWVAHRFLADVLAREGDTAASHDHLVSAVACNPIYDLAWNDLERTVGPGWRRVVAAPPADRATVTVTPDTDPETLVGALLAKAPWAAWQDAASAAGGSALDQHRAGARAALVKLGELGELGPRSEGLWALLAQADAAGQLDAALFLSTADPDLLAEYPAWLAAHPGEAEAWIRGALAPLP